MMPPICSIRFAPCGPSEIVSFALTEEDRREQEAMRRAETDGVAGHPSNASWFRALHFPEAAALADLTSAKAHMQMNGTRRIACEQATSSP